MYLGEFTPGKTIVRRFNSHKADGTPIALAGTPAISVYKNSTTESTSGVTLTVDYDSRTGMNHVAIDTSADGTFYAAGNDFDIVITTGTVDSISVVGMVVGSFSLSNRAGIRPTVADRTLDVSSDGEAGLDWANVGTPGSTVSLSATTVGTATAVTTVNGLAANVITATSIAADAITAAKIADGAIDAATFAASAITANAIATDAITAAKIAADAITSAKIAADAITAAKIENGAIDAAAIADDAITAAKIANGAIDALTFAAGAIDAAAIAADAITAAKIANGAIDAATFAAGAINAAAIDTGAITSDKFGAGAINAAALATDAANEIRDAVWAQAMSELASVPGVTDTVLAALQWLFLTARNKITQTSTTQLLRNNADSATIGTSTVSDDGTTFTRGKFA